MAALQRAAEIQQKKDFSVSEMKMVAQSAGVKSGNFLDFLESLNNQGILLKKGYELYKLLTQD